uniref:Uncharacterized protein n=1 Tax=viral metagenome TaxID=1070528 RepID=A0A6C0EU03_9ZZZZ
MESIEYGNVIKIISSDSTYDDKYFFVDRLYDDKLVLITDKETVTLGITDQSLDDKSIIEIIIVYKPSTKGYINQNKLMKDQWIDIQLQEPDAINELDELDKISGKILDINDYTIEVKVKEEILYIPLDRGLPKEIKNIKKIFPKDKEKEKEKNKLEIEDGILDVVEEEIELEETQYFYSIEQQKNDFLENLLMYVPLEERNPRQMKTLHKMMTRYTELRDKYTTFSDGIYVNHLHYDQIFNTTVSMKNKLFVPITKNIEINLDPLDEDDVKTRPNYYKQSDDEWLINMRDTLFKDSIPFKDKQNIFDNYDNDKVYHNKVLKNQLLYTPKKYELAYIETYPLSMNKTFVIDSLMSHPKFYIDYSKINQDRSSIMNKSDLNLCHYYPFLYETTNFTVDNKFVNMFCDTDGQRVVYKNKEETFDSYIKKIIPSLRTFVDCYTDAKYVNMMSVLKGLNIMNINELTAPNFILMSSLIKKTVHQIKQNEMKTRKGYITKQHNYKVKESQFATDIINEYVKDKKLDKYYSPTEIFKMAEVDLYKFYNFNYVIKHQSLTNEINEEEITKIIETIKSDKEQPLEKRINKMYHSEEQMVMDNYKQVIIQDIPLEQDVQEQNAQEQNEVAYINSLELLHRELIGLKKYNRGLEIFMENIYSIIQNDMKYNPKMFVPDVFKRIKEYILKNKIIKGHIAYVEETKKRYVWDQEKWLPFDDGSCVLAKKLVSIKGDCDVAEKEERYNKKIMEMIRNIEKDKLLLDELRHFYNEESREELKNKLKISIKKRLYKELKYNNEKIYLEQEELEKETDGHIDSPHSKLRDKILQTYQLDVKYKAIQLFIERYTKKMKDPYWYYCVDTNVKLLPTFFNKLSVAFLITNRYAEAFEEICLEQGTLSDNGDTWVDKYSGYIIKTLDFDNDEGYTDGGFKNVSRGTIDKPLVDEFFKEAKEENRIRNSIRVLIKYAGLADLEEDETEELLKRVNNTFVLASRGIKNPAEIDYVYVISIISNILVYIQTLTKGKIKFIKPFPNCKFSFGGFPLTDKGHTGLTYLCCIVFKMEKPDPPFNSIKGVKMDDLEKKSSEFISKFLLTNIEIEEKLKERRKEEEEEIEEIPYSSWKLFLPRLKKMRPVLMQDTGNYDDQIYYWSFIIQHKINRYVEKQPPILINHNQEPYLVNACCNEINNTYTFFTKKDPSIVDDLTEIKRLLKLKKRQNKALKHLIMYSYENTKKTITSMSVALDDTTLYVGLIKLFNFDNIIPIPITLTKFDIKKPEFYNKNDDLNVKIQKLKEHGYEMNDETLYKMLKSSATIVRQQIKKEEEIVPFEPIDPIFEIIRGGGKVKNEAYKMLTQKKGECLKITKTEMYDSCLSMEFKTEKHNYTIPVELEHFTYMSQIIYNKIQSLINFSEMVTSKKNQGKITCDHWKLSEYHYGDIDTFVSSYYRTLTGYFKNDELSQLLLKHPLDKYKQMLNTSIRDPESKYLVYLYIFTSIYYDYLSTKSKLIREYLDAITMLFNHENKRALDFDLTTIKYEIKLSKKSETQIKTAYFAQLGNDELVSENTMKNLKLGKWGVGLQKSMFEYDKETYSRDKTAADEVIALIGEEPLEGEGEVEVIDEYEGFMAEDDEYQEGFDGDEMY